MRPTCGAKVPSRALSREFGEEYISVVDADPEPDAWHALFAFKRANATHPDAWIFTGLGCGRDERLRTPRFSRIASGPFGRRFKLSRLMERVSGQ